MSGAQFCASCGTPVAPAPVNPGLAPQVPAAGAPSSAIVNPTPPSGTNPLTAPTGLPGAPASPPLSTVLGVQNETKFLLQHVLLGAKHSYRVMDLEKRHLFTVGENLREERQVGWMGLLGHVPGGEVPMVNWNGVSHPSMAYWVLDDATGNLRGTLTLQAHVRGAMCTLADEGGTPSLIVNVTRGPLSITANATSSDGRPMLETRGELLHHNFSVHDPSGTEVAKIHEAWASVRDTYHLEMVRSADPLSAIVFAILIDHYKGK